MIDPTLIDTPDPTQTTYRPPSPPSRGRGWRRMPLGLSAVICLASFVITLALAVALIGDRTPQPSPKLEAPTSTTAAGSPTSTTPTGGSGDPAAPPAERAPGAVDSDAPAVESSPTTTTAAAEATPRRAPAAAADPTPTTEPPEDTTTTTAPPPTTPPTVVDTTPTTIRLPV